MSADPSPLAAQLGRARLAWENRDPAALAPAAPPQDAEERAALLARIADERFDASCPARFTHARLADLPEPRRSEVAAWTHAPEGRNLVLSGPVGCGKTHAAVAAVRDARPRSWLISTAVGLLDQLRPGGDPGAFDRACRVSLLLLDDVGAERRSEWTDERLAAVIDRRWTDEVPIVATTNLTLGPDGELIEALGERSYSRLVGSSAVVLQLQGADRRRNPEGPRP